MQTTKSFFQYTTGDARQSELSLRYDERVAPVATYLMVEYFPTPQGSRGTKPQQSIGFFAPREPATTHGSRKGNARGIVMVSHE